MLRLRPSQLFLIFFSGASLFFSGPAFAANNPDAPSVPNDECLTCHSDFHEEKFHASVHGKLQCVSCHKGIPETPHADVLPKVDCSNCHRIEAEIYNASDHGKAREGGARAASCKDCHGNAHELADIHAPDSPVNRLNIPKMCAHCHEDTKAMEPFGLLEKEPYKSYSTTVHGVALLGKGDIASATCTDCHGSHDLHAPTDPESKIHRSHVATTCGKCHENVLKTYQRSIHGKAAAEGKVEAPVCTDCHGEHTIKSRFDPTSRVYPSSVSEKVCAQCHAAEKITSKYHLPADRVETYFQSYHGLASRFGMTTVANCASCHGAHDILPAKDPDSSVNKKNLKQTCGKCHPNVSERLAEGQVHVSSSSREGEPNLVQWVRIFYLFLIFFVVGGMLVHNGLDFLKKLREHYLKNRAQKAAEVRFTRSERIQHAVLAATFIVLAYTGFALRYHEAWWALPVFTAKGGVDWRGVVHRAAAVIFSILALYHAGYVFFTPRGRAQAKALLPRPGDFKEAAAFVGYNLGKGKKRPEFGRYSYIEKMEYWALVWGAVIMIVTGLLLVFENWSMRYFPKWALDVAGAVHFYEAVLATLAIVVWHFYFTIFDPDHYPMNWSMTTGKGTDKPESQVKHSQEDTDGKAK